VGRVHEFGAGDAGYAAEMIDASLVNYCARGLLAMVNAERLSRPA
jgi:hypothetical protein